VSKGGEVDVKIEEIDEERDQKLELEMSQKKKMIKRVISEKGKGSE